MSKKELRRRTLEFRRTIPPARIMALSRMVEENLVVQEAYRSAKSLASYVAEADEVQTAAILERALSEGKIVAVPLANPSSDMLLFYKIYSKDDLSPGRFGIFEPKGTGSPVPLEESDVVLVPLIAWDERGHRIGHGKGYFDRALAARGHTFAIGLAFESQLVPHVPDERYDVPLDMVVTEKRALKFFRRP